LRDLDSINYVVKSTHSIFLISLILPTVIGVLCWAISRSAGSAPENWLSLSGIATSLVALFAVPVSYLLRWDWRTCYYGASMSGIASVALLGIYPALSIVFYSSLPLILRLLIFCMEVGLVVWWCRRFVRIYDVIDRDKSLFHCIYVEDSNVFYLNIQGDKYVLERKIKFSQFPQARYFLISLCGGIIILIFFREITSFLGMPFVHLFWAAIFAPYPAAFLGMTTKVWLICYKYPSRIRARTGKLTYVDMASKGNKPFFYANR
jgi:hypothetical protein